MSNAVFFNSYKIKKSSTVQDFTQSVNDLAREHVSKQRGFISMGLLSNDEMWADFGIFKTMEDAKHFESGGDGPNEFAEKFYSFLNFSTCKSRMFSVERDYQLKSETPKAVTVVMFKLKKGASVPDFLLASEKTANELPAGCISSKLLTNGDTWMDLAFWQSMDDAKNEAGYDKDVFREYFSFIGKVETHQHFTVEQFH